MKFLKYFCFALVFISCEKPINIDNNKLNKINFNSLNFFLKNNECAYEKDSLNIKSQMLILSIKDERKKIIPFINNLKINSKFIYLFEHYVFDKTNNKLYLDNFSVITPKGNKLYSFKDYKKKNENYFLYYSTLSSYDDPSFYEIEKINHIKIDHNCNFNNVYIENLLFQDKYYIVQFNLYFKSKKDQPI